MRLIKFLLWVLLISPLASIAQHSVVGKLIDENGNAVKQANITLSQTSLKTMSDDEGNYKIENVPSGSYIMLVTSEGYNVASQQIVVGSADYSAGSLTVYHEGKQAEETINADNIDPENRSDAAVSSSLSASRDAFTSATSFTFSAARFRERGYDSDNEMLYMNGALMQDLANGRGTFNLWSGLNDVVRSRDGANGLEPALFAFGGIGGVTSIDSRASKQRKQLQVSYAASNRTYDNRLMVTYGSGIKNGWSYSISGSRRWADEGYVDGTFYDGFSYFAAVEKQIGFKHSLALTAFGSPYKSGRAGNAVQEIFDLLDNHYYNPFWGYQQGAKRNSSVINNFQPAFILTHDWKVDNSASMVSAVSYITGKNKLSGLDWFEAPDPRADYYRNLPSFDPYYGDNEAQQMLDSLQKADLFTRQPELLQVQWDKLYEANYISGDTARYILENRVTDNKRFSFNTYYNRSMNDHLTISTGINYIKQNTEYYKEVNDLLGAEYYIDVNKYAEQDYPLNNDALQNDLNNPNRLLYEGDRFGYDYNAHISKGGVWGQGMWKYNRFDYFAAFQLMGTSMYRTGNVRNGIFSNNSFGDSPKESFFNGNLKGGITYKYNGRNYFFFNAGFYSRAPYFEDIYNSPSSNNRVISKPESEKITSFEGGYLMRAPKVKLRAVLYTTKFNDGTNTIRFFHDDYRTFVNYTLTNVDKSHSGMELAADLQIGKGISVIGVAAIGNYIYTDRMLTTVTQDNKDSVVAQNETVYSKNLHVTAGPQSAYTFGVNYRSKRFWFVNLNVNFFSRFYEAFNPARRTKAALDLVDGDSPLFEELLSQKQLDDQVTVDLFAGWSWRLNNKFKNLKKPTFIVLNAGINNILNNQDMIVTSFEQSRFDYSSKDINKFAPKRSYAYGTNFFVSLTYRMN